MQTFLPFKDFKASAKVLDYSRLGKQRAEVKQLLIGIYFQELKTNGVLASQARINPEILSSDFYKIARNHPAKIMWEDYPFALIAYGLAICKEWRSRGYADETLESIEAFGQLNSKIPLEQSLLEKNWPNLLPPWLGDEKLHLSHRSNLLRKDPVWYGCVQGWTDPKDLEYFWPGRM